MQRMFRIIGMQGIAPVKLYQMAETIMRMKKQRLTLVLSEQNLRIARLVLDRAIIIEGGQKRFGGTFAELDAQPEIQEQFLSVYCKRPTTTHYPG